jgi:hypothetical protein
MLDIPTITAGPSVIIQLMKMSDIVVKLQNIAAPCLAAAFIEEILIIYTSLLAVCLCRYAVEGRDR